MKVSIADKGEKSTGTGLALHTCSEIVHSYDGTTELNSEAGQGTTFVIRLPGADD